jgi:hypothetical protein
MATAQRRKFNRWSNTVDTLLTVSAVLIESTLVAKLEGLQALGDDRLQELGGWQGPKRH